MPTKRDAPSTTDEIRLLGQALRTLRLRQGLTQQEAADAYGVTRGAWQNYENGRAVLLRTDIQSRLAAALGADREELLLQLTAATAPRDRRALSGLAERDPHAFDLGDRQQAVFPLGDGEVVLTYPADISPDGLTELASYIDLFIKARRRRDA